MARATRGRTIGARAPRRLLVLFTVFMVGFGGLGLRLAILQTVESTAYAKRAADQRLRVREFPARRGAILDRAERPLALSVDFETIIADPANVTSPAAEARKLARILGLPYETVRASLGGGFPGDRFEYVQRRVDPDTAKAIAKLGLPGITSQPEPKRVYPNGRLASQVLGFVNIDGTALDGAELEYDDILKGRPGRMTLEQDPYGNSLPQGAYSYHPPRPGRSVVLTLDKDIQYYTELALRQAVAQYHARGGTVIVMRPRSGQIVAMANYPDFNPNSFEEATSQDLRDRAITDVYEPGSVFKIVTTSGALEEGVVKPRTKLTVPYSKQIADRVLHDAESHPTERMSVRDIIVNSSNVGTVTIGMRLGRERIQEYIHKFGFGSRTGLDFPGEEQGLVLPPSQWSGSTIANVPIGQGIAVTPLQLASAYGALANGGRWVEPQLLSGTLNRDEQFRPAAAPATHRVVSAKTARQMASILTGVVAEGTGVEAGIPGYEVAGKTGTAQKPQNGGYGSSFVASFVGFAPATRPALLTLVTLDDPTPIYGGSTAAPTFTRIMEFALRHLGVPPTSTAKRPTGQAAAPQ